MIISIRRWLTSPIVEDAGIDRPFRLRRVSLLLMAGGWGVFLMTCLIGLWMVRNNVPVLGWADAIQGIKVSAFERLQWIKVAAEVVGGAMFFAGMFSVTFFDRRDRIPVWKAE